MCQRVMSLIAMIATTKIKADSFLGPDLLQKCLLTLCGFPPNTGETDSYKKWVERDLHLHIHAWWYEIKKGLKTQVSQLSWNLLLWLQFCPLPSTSTLEHRDYHCAGHKDVLMTRERFSREQCGGIQVGCQIIIMVILARWKVLFRFLSLPLSIRPHGCSNQN